MRSFHPEKKGLRGLTIAESFGQDNDKAVLAGVVMRSDLVIDGFVFGGATLAGNDATCAILDMHARLGRSDVNYVLVSGMILSRYNVVDLKELHEALRIPVIGLSYHDSDGIESAIRQNFPNSFEPKVAAYRKLGGRQRIRLRTSHDVFVRVSGCTTNDAACILNKLTLHGSVPEPVRVSRLAARALDAFQA